MLCSVVLSRICYIRKETRKGFISTFTFKCAICKTILEVCTDEPNTEVMDVNVAAVSAMVTTGGGYSQLSEIAAVMNIPAMSRDLFTNSENQLADVIEDSTWLSIKDAGLEEATLARNAGDVDDAGIPCITVIADGAWSKRSYRVNYNASSGVACIIGQRTGKILFIGVRNKYCCICDRTKRIAAEPVQHKCFKNWEGPATGMESDIIVDGFSRSIDMHGVKYTKLVGDGDSSVHRKLLQTRPYGPDVLVEKIECSNHLLRNYCAKLKDLSHRRYSSSGKAVSVTMRNVLGTNIRRLRTAVEYAAKYRRMDKTWTSACEQLQQDIINSPNHVFGDHTHCAAYFCTGKKSGETNWIPEMKLCGLYQDIVSTLNRLASNTKSLYLNMTNNAAETYNSVVAKFSGGKRINFSRRGSYQLRCSAAALSYKSKGQMHSIIHKKITTRSPGQHTKRYIHNMVARYSKRKAAGPRIRKKLTFTTADTEYGPDAAQTVEDMTATDYAFKKNQFLARLNKSQEEIIAIERNTVGQSANHSWHVERMNRITASNFGRVCKLRHSTNCLATVKSLLYSTFTGNASTRYGIAHESVAIKAFEESYNLKVESCGIFIDNKFFFLAASPDGLVDEDSIIEIKCPANSTKLSPVDSISQKKTNFSTYNNDKFAVKRNHNYYYQVQGQLHITKRQYCYFIFWTPLGMLVEKIEKDDNFWMERMQNQLKFFYFDCLLPEIIDPRHPRKLQIRNPEYREKK